MKVVTHNIKRTLNYNETKTCVRRALTSRPQIAGLQEIDDQWDGVLKLYGEFVDRDHLQFNKASKKDYLICRGKASVLPVLLRRTYVDRISSIDTVNVATRAAGVRPTPGTRVIFTNRFGREIALLNTHPMAHHDKPKYLAAFKRAADYCDKFVEVAHHHGQTPMIIMDGNGLKEIEGVSSCWTGHKNLPTGPGGNTIDMVFTWRYSDDVHTFQTPSDHNGVIATYENFH